MEAGEVRRAEAALRHERGGEGVAEREGQQRARRRHEAERIGFGARADVEDDVGLGREGRLRVADDRDDRGLEGTEDRDKADQFGRGAGT